jgi:hypothetical protein
MKTTLDLPDDLLLEIKLRAVREGKRLKDAMAELLRKGMVASSEPVQPPHKPIIASDARTGLPIVITRHAASAAEEFTPQRVADLLLQQEATWQHDASG